MPWWMLLILVLGPPGFIVLHTLIGVLLMVPYGVESIRWNEWAIEVVAKKRDRRTTRIWFQPAAQTWGLLIFYADERLLRRPGLRKHERVHILQSLLFGLVYPVTYLFSFGVLFALVKLGWDWWERDPDDDDVWHAYRKIPWEIWAYWVQDRFERRRAA